MTGRPGFGALAPFFRIIEEGLSGLVDGEDFFGTLGEDAVFEYVISVPGYPRRVAGRPVRHNDIERSAWIDGAIAAGVVPADYAVMLNWLTATIASGHGSRPNDDVLRVTGSPSASLADFARRNARAWAVPAALW